MIRDRGPNSSHDEVAGTSQGTADEVAGTSQGTADEVAGTSQGQPRRLPNPGRHRGSTALDLSLAHWIKRRALTHGASQEDAHQLAVTVALLAQERGRGHSCLELRRWAGRSFALPDEATPFKLPALRPWLACLSRSPLVSDGDRETPLVVAAGTRLYLYRYWAAEQRLSGHLRKLLATRREVYDPAVVTLFQRLFPPTSDEVVDRQALAAAIALHRDLALISGGPGTGKTTTVSRILALLLTAQPRLRIALAAPTGKAATRLAESIVHQVDTLDLPESTLQRLPRQASTLHRLLGYRRHQRRFVHGPSYPLSCDLLVVDEASMVDLVMMDALVAALPVGGRLVLLGDRDQLTSVETGFVFGDLCRGAQLGGYSESFSGIYAELSGQSKIHQDVMFSSTDRPQEDPPSAHLDSMPNPLQDASSELNVNYRFRSQPGIGALAMAIRDQDSSHALAVLADGSLPDVAWQPHPQPEREVLTPLKQKFLDTVEAATPRLALEQLAGYRVLAATRKGPWGIEQLNRWAEEFLLEQDLVTTVAASDLAADGQNWYLGRPLLITHNDYQVRLFNGDLGICGLEDGQLRVFFDGDGQRHQSQQRQPENEDSPKELRSLPLGKLPAHETAWAMTVHKSQGSEFDDVLLILPQQDSPLLGRELIYTAITRARRKVTIIGPQDVLIRAIERRTRRASGLINALLGSEPSDEASADPNESTDRPPIEAYESFPPKDVIEDGNEDIEVTQNPTPLPPKPRQLTLFPDGARDEDRD